jgi:predicted alpha/beta superfamily hydrolase
MIYLSGNNSSLGDWNGRGLAVSMQNGEGVVQLCVSKKEKLEFKITAGSWDREAIYADGKIPSNFTVMPAQDTTLLIEVVRWRDELKEDKSGMTGDFHEFPDMAYSGIMDRDVTVRLPDNYENSDMASYPVLYVHDGQNVFNPNSSTLGIDWSIDEWVDSLVEARSIQPLIVVAINCTGDRYADYSPGKKGENYMNFVVDKLKPMIDSLYRTKSGRENTAVMGASMGGLISFMMHWQHNEIFGKAACLSPALLFRDVDYTQSVKEYKGPQKKLDVFLSNGSIGLEKELQTGCDQMMKALDDAGYTYRWVHDVGAEHNEKAWRRLTGDILIWMFGN